MEDEELEPKTVRLPGSLWREIIELQHDMRLANLAHAYRTITVAGIAAIRAAHPEINREI